MLTFQLPATVGIAACLSLGGVFTESIQASDTGRTARGCAKSTSLVRSNRSYAVDVRGLVHVHRAPGGKAFARFGRLNINNVPTVFAALEAVPGARCRAAWYRVMIPLKPHGQTGYVRAREVRLRPVRTRIVVDLSTRRLTVFDHGKRVLGENRDRRAVDPDPDRPLLRQPAVPGRPAGPVWLGRDRHLRIFGGPARLAPGRACRDPRHQPSVPARPADLQRLHSRQQRNREAALAAGADRDSGAGAGVGRADPG